MIILIGVAGSGKSVQGKLLAREIDAKYFSMGEFLRLHVDPGIQKKMLTGQLISDQEVINVIDDELSRVKNENEIYILDGFPRTIAQTDWLLNEVKKGRILIDGVINLKASPEVIVPRLLERKRQDDNIATINQRIKEYNKQTLPIIERLKEAKVKIFDINAEQTVENVNRDIYNNIKSVI